MRRFQVFGGECEGRIVSIKHGKKVRFAGSQTDYQVFSEPLGDAMGTLVPINWSVEHADAYIRAACGWKD